MKKFFISINWKYILYSLFDVILAPALLSGVFVGLSLLVVILVCDYNKISGTLDCRAPVVFIFGFSFLILIITETLNLIPISSNDKKIHRLDYLLRKMNNKNKIILLDMIEDKKDILQ